MIQFLRISAIFITLCGKTIKASDIIPQQADEYFSATYLNIDFQN